MLRTMIFTTALAMAAPAIAQDATMPQQPAPGAATPAQPGSAQPGTAQPGAGAQPEAAQPSSQAATVASIVESEFPAYDTNKDQQLDKAEFSKWMVALKDQEMKATGKTLPPAEVTAWAEGAFATADVDKSGTVSKSELVSFLGGGAG
ncbi:EF-hand domain-containing protein [Sphingobium cloacae]|nr:EF-hand domain-containing protein [Sphingobium cloacae]